MCFYRAASQRCSKANTSTPRLGEKATVPLSYSLALTGTGWEQAGRAAGELWMRLSQLFQGEPFGSPSSHTFGFTYLPGCFPTDLRAG